MFPMVSPGGGCSPGGGGGCSPGSPGIGFCSSGGGCVHTEKKMLRFSVKLITLSPI